jgi:hypothetical protein
MPDYPQWESRIAICPKCSAEINEDTDVYDFGSFASQGLYPQPKPRYKEHGVAPPMPTKKRGPKWQCPSCKRLLARRQLEFVAAKEENADECATGVPDRNA